MVTATATLTAAIERVGKVLALEQRQGHGDRAVLGGIGPFARQHLAPLRGSLPTRAADDALVRIDARLNDYSSRTPALRQPRLNEALTALRRLYVQVARLGENDPTSQPRYVGKPKTKSERAKGRTGEGAIEAPRPKPAPAPALALDDPVTAIPTVGEGRAIQLGLIGVRTVGDVLAMLPRKHMDYSAEYPIAHALFGREGTFKGTIQTIEEKHLPGKKSLVVAEIGDRTGMLTATWFSPYIARALHVGDQVVLSGAVGQRRGRLVLENPEWEALDADLLHTGRIVPVYKLTKGLYQKTLRTIVRKALDLCADALPDYLPETVRQRARLVPLARATRAVHFPQDDEELAAAKYRLGFDEFFLLQLGMQRRKRQWQNEAPGYSFAIDEAVLDRFFGVLPFALTRAQQRVLADILADMRRPVAMSRLVQGDVGSGKTVVAATAMLAAKADGYQSSLMAPTAILAEQHWRTLERLYGALPEGERPQVRLLIGSTPAKERRAIAAGLEDGSIDILVGTQALIQGGVAFRQLGFAVVDEQHRFGVVQRATLRAKGHNPDLLVMTATPIPRSLALTLHGDLEVSVIDELPPGRQAIITRAVGPEERVFEYGAIRAEVRAGRQAFVICPLVEESDQIEAKAATEEWERLRTEVFPDLRVALLHGRMRPAEKDAVMAAFRDREYDILVSTAVIEVGIDIPNASIMLIEGANRFGLAQLHQFRGRVGRGAAQSYCILVADETSADAEARLSAMVDSQDGFVLAQKDLDMRGPGDFFGTRRSGLPDLKVAQLGDVRLLELARREAETVLDADVDLAHPDHQPLRDRLRVFWKEGAGDVS
ncbi:MAG: ATP-dependent DNA helicase RecG [Thermomicrobiales bacterium]